MSSKLLEENKFDIVYDCRWSHEVDAKFIGDFCFVENQVFGGYSKEKFACKFQDNIYGQSVVEVVYLNAEPVAARALWRNDIDEKKCYQPCDTCVLEVCRGKGIFTKMTQKAMELLPENAVVYNFPNPNSFPGYIKMGWKVKHEYGERLFTRKRYQQEHTKVMDDAYADWWLKSQTKYRYIKRKGKYYVVSSIGHVFCYNVLAEVSERIAKRYKRLRLGIVFYRSSVETFYNKKRMKLRVVYNASSEIDYIPTWKMDAI